MRFVSTIRKLAYQRERKSLHHKLGNGSRHKTNGSDTGTFLYITGHHSAQRSIRRIVKRIKAHQQGIRQRSIQCYQPFIFNARIIESQHIENHERQRSPKHPRTIFPETCLGAVTQ